MNINKYLFLISLIFLFSLGFLNSASATTEFTCVVDPDNDTGTDYTSLSAWEQYNQTDLTAATTLVFSHGGITGTIADDDTVTGATSGATATVVHATETQILLESISGTFQSGEQVYETQDTNYVTTTNAGNPAIAVAKIDGAWTNADETAVTIDGWTTGPNNYVKVYTTDDARHDGVWDEGKYRLEVSTTHSLMIYENYAVIEGLQLNSTKTSGTAPRYVIWFYDGGNYGTASHCIIDGSGIYSGVVGYGISFQSASDDNISVYNNVIYGFSANVGSRGINLSDSGATGASIYNNTVYDCSYGIFWSIGYAPPVKNCAVFGNTDDFRGDTTNVDYCASDDGDGDHSVQPSDWGNVFVDYTNGDFHLDPADTDLIDQGTDLSSDSNLAFSDDIDSETRTNHTWDIGADEAAEKIYRSVGPSASTALETGTGNNLEISGTTATFASALGDDVGVGDVIQYDDDNDGDIDADDSVAFIHGRTSSTVYTVKNSTGGTPTATAAADQDWSIFRAYDSLSHAESGDENDSIDDDLEAFESWSGGKDLTSSNEQWNIACYNGEGDVADTTAVTMDGWTTGENNYIKVYTPTETDEVGTSQRHEGVWNEERYRLEVAVTGSGEQSVLNIIDNYIKIEGLQIYESSSSPTSERVCISYYSTSGSGEWHIYDNILKTFGDTTYHYGIRSYNTEVSQTFYIKNNIIYDGRNGIFIRGTSSGGIAYNVYLYNNTVYNFSVHGISICYCDSDSKLKNNIVIASSSVSDYWFPTPGSNVNEDYITNISSDGTAPDNDVHYSVSFADESNDDFHLSSTDTSAKDAGTDLSSDSDLSFSDDVDGDTRPSPLWDIGADEYPATVKTEFKGTVDFLGNVEIK